MATEAEVVQAPGEVLCEEPRIVLYRNFISPEEIAHLLKLVEDKWEPSTVVDNVTGGPTINADYRRGLYAHLGAHRDPIVDRIHARVAEYSETRVAQGEFMQLVKYGPGDQYKVHHDWFDPKLEGPRAQLKQGGQRIRTALMCCKSAEEGGETEFPHLAIKVKLEPGDLLMFNQYDHTRLPSKLTEHIAHPVVKGEKIVITRWIRERAFDGSEEKADPAEIRAAAAKRAADARAAAEALVKEAQEAATKDAQQRLHACHEEIAAALKKYRCRLYGQPDIQLGKGGQLMVGATVELDPEE